MNKAEGTWQLESIQPWINDTEQEAILRVPIHEGVEQDKKIWPGDKSGNYSVKSGYAIQKSATRRMNSSRASSSHQVDKRNVVSEFLSIWGKPDKVMVKPVRQQGGWERPKQGWFKVNCDGGYCNKPSQAGIGFIIRNHHGKLITGAGKKVLGGSALIIEALAVKEDRPIWLRTGLLFSLGWGCAMPTLVGINLPFW
ncbi:hypothetical protein COLO4_33276 [Corchorus olitorius]|uniref:RNase H type-1 domain-containing protein n=1 Tax=Corchorus olitorius TaxID=93759 RepID=A0A1R3GVD3_9ROSI|nr:hypothetical protein COLO4_33276 [Corchorus olitorius]